MPRNHIFLKTGRDVEAMNALRRNDGNGGWGGVFPFPKPTRRYAERRSSRSGVRGRKRFLCIFIRKTAFGKLMDVNSLPNTVTRQRRNCDLNPGPALESSTLTTRLSSHDLLLLFIIITTVYFAEACSTTYKRNINTDTKSTATVSSVHWNPSHSTGGHRRRAGHEGEGLLSCTWSPAATPLYILVWQWSETLSVVCALSVSALMSVNLLDPSTTWVARRGTLRGTRGDPPTSAVEGWGQFVSSLWYVKQDRIKVCEGRGQDYY